MLIVGGSAIAAVLLGLFCSTQQCHAFGAAGHLGAYQAALQRLRALDTKYCAFHWDTSWINACNYPDEAMTYANLPEGYIRHYRFTHPILGTIDIPIDCSFVFEVIYAMNSSDHYFDPTQPSRTATDPVGSLADDVELAAYVAERAINALPNATLMVLTADQKAALKAELSAFVQTLKKPMGRTYQEFLDKAPGTEPLDGTDGNGHNAVSAILFYLNGQSNKGTCNPSGLSPDEGFIRLAGKGEYQDACIALGCVAHYVADLFSAGHTDWDYTHLIYFSAPLGPNWLRHKAFDEFGDKYLSYQDDLKQNTFLELRPILSFTSAEEVCTEKGKAATSLRLDWDKDVPNVLRDIAMKSKQLWEDNQPDSAKNREHLNNAVGVTAGVIDWAFSRAAEKADGPYERDATNFYGMAASLHKSGDGTGAIVTPREQHGERCWLGGIDQDDYFPVVDNDTRYLSVRVYGEGSVGAQVWLPEDGVSDKAQRPWCEGSLETAGPITTLKLDLTDHPPREFLLRVYTRERSQNVLSYTVSEWDEPARPEGKIAFTSYRDLVRGRACEPRCGEIYMMNPDGSEKTRLTHNESEDKAPTWSPDGKKIAFQSMRDGDWELYMIDVETREETRLTYHFGPDEAPAWSPVNNQIAFHSANEGPGVVAREEGGSRAPYPKASDFFHVSVITGPRQICVMDVGDGNVGFSLFSISDILDWHQFCNKLTANRDARGPSRRIWDLFSSQARSAAEDAAREVPLDEERKSHVAKALNEILGRRDFYREEDFGGVSLPREAKRLLRKDRESLSDKEVEKLNRLLLVAAFPSEIACSQNIWVVTGETFSSTHPCWSPDGGRLAFQSTGGRFRSDIYVVDVARAEELIREGKRVKLRNTRCVTESASAGCALPAWSPDRRIAFCGGHGDLWIVDPDVSGGLPIQLTQTLNIAERCPTWSTKGRIAFQSNYDSCNNLGTSQYNNDIYVIDVRRRGSGAGGVTHYEARLTEDTAEDSWPSWSPVAAPDDSNGVTENARDRGNSVGKRVLAWLGLGTAALCAFVAYRLLRRP